MNVQGLVSWFIIVLQPINYTNYGVSMLIYVEYMTRNLY